MLRGNEGKAQHALPDEREAGERRNNYATQVQMRSQVDHRPVSGEMCRAELPGGNQFRRASVLLPRRQGRLRHSLRSRRKGRTRFQRPPDRRRRFLTKQRKELEVSVMSINKAIVVGNLGRDPEVRALPSGQNVANLSVATKARFKDRNGEQQERTEWHRIVAFGKLADNCQRLLSKGRQVYVEGRLTTRQYEAKDGSGTHYRTEIVARQIRFLGRRSDAAGQPATSEAPF